MEDIQNNYTSNTYANDVCLKLFFEKFSEKRNKIYEYIYNLLENRSDKDKKRQIKDIINDTKINIFDKVEKIKKLKMIKYLKNIKNYYNPEELKKYNLGLIYNSFPISIQLVYYKNNEELKKNKENEIQNDNINLNKKSEKDIDKYEKTEKMEEKMNVPLILFDIDFITKIKINDDDEEECVCNSDYTLYLIYIIKKLKNPHPTIYDDEESLDSSSYSLIDKLNIEHFIYITNNKDDRLKKNLIEVEADLDIL